MKLTGAESVAECKNVSTSYGELFRGEKRKGLFIISARFPPAGESGGMKKEPFCERWKLEVNVGVLKLMRKIQLQD